jgi:phosphatidylglycerol:prolipoprotein diacylglycerol transferase
MRPIPVVFHIGALQVHTYGIGLAITFWFGYRYFARRLRSAGLPDAWLGGTFVWILVASIVGARVVHVVANLGYYDGHALQVFAIWNGGLSSFGGLALAVPVGLISAHRRCPELRAVFAIDLVAPVLIASWAIGRLLGPQLMVAGGGKPTSQWLGMYYAGEIGKRLPVPVFQALECAAVYLIVIALESFLAERDGPFGVVAAVTIALWGLSRFVDEYFWLGHDNGTDAVEITSLCLFGLGMAFTAVALVRWARARQRAQREPIPVGDRT